MNEFRDIASIVLPVFLVMGVGFAFRRTSFVDEQAQSSLSRIVFYMAAPALLFRGAATTPFREALQLKVIGVVIICTVLAAALIYLFSWRLAPSRRGVLCQGAHRTNMVFFGLPIILYAFGEEAVGRAAVLIGFMVVVYNTLAVVVLVAPHQSNGQGGRIWRTAAWEIAKNPLLISCLAGTLVYALGWKLPSAIDRALELLALIAAPLALIVLGAGLDLGRLRADLGPAMVASLLKLIVYPAFIFGALLLVGAETRDTQITTLILASPTATVSYIMAREMKGDEPLAGAIVIGTTLASLITTSAWLWLFRVVIQDL